MRLKDMTTNRTFLRELLLRIGAIREERAAYGPLCKPIRESRRRQINRMVEELDLDGLDRLITSLATVDIDVISEVLDEWRRRETEATRVRFEYEDMEGGEI